MTPEQVYAAAASHPFVVPGDGWLPPWETTHVHAIDYCLEFFNMNFDNLDAAFAAQEHTQAVAQLEAA